MPPYDPWSQYGPGGTPSGSFSSVPLISGSMSNVPQTQTQAQMADPNALAQIINQKAQLIQQQAQPIMPQYIPRQYGSPSGGPAWADPNTRAGMRANIGRSVGEAIGGAITQIANRKEMQKAQNIAMDMQRLSMAIQNPTDENKAMAEEILNNDKRRNEIAKTMNMQFMGDDKRKPYQKVANQIFHHKQAQQQQQQAQQAQQQRLQQNLAQKQTPYFNQLQRRMPTMPGLSPEAMIDAQAIQLNLQPGAKEKLEFLSRAMTDQTNLDRSIMTAGWENTRTQALVIMKAAEIQGRHIDAAARDAVTSAKTEAEFRSAMARVGASYAATQARRDIAAGAQQTARDVAGIRAKTEQEKLEQKNLKLSLDTQMKNYQTQLAAKNRELSDAAKSIDKLQGQVPSKNQQAELNNAKTRQHQLEGEINELTNSLQNVSNFSKYMEKTQTQPTAAPTPTQAPAQPTVAPPTPIVPTAPTAQDILFNSIFKNASSDFGEDDEP